MTELNAQEAMAVVEALRAIPDAGHRAILTRYLPVDSPLLVEMSKDEDGYVRMTAAWYLPPVDNPRFVEMAKDKDWRVRANVARRLPFDSPLLLELSQDSERWVQLEAARRLKEKA